MGRALGNKLLRCLSQSSILMFRTSVRLWIKAFLNNLLRLAGLVELEAGLLDAQGQEGHTGDVSHLRGFHHIVSNLNDNNEQFSFPYNI